MIDYDTAVAKAKEWLDTGAKIIFLHHNGIVLRKDGYELSIVKHSRYAFFRKI